MKRLLLNCFLLLSLFSFSGQFAAGQSCVNDNYCDNDADLLLNCPDVPTWTEYFWEITEIDGTGNPGTVIPELIRVDGSDYYFTPSNVPNGYIGVELYVVCVRGTPSNRQGQLWKSVRVRPAPSVYDLSGPADVCQGEAFTMQLANSEGVTTTYRLFSEDSGSPKGVSGGQNGTIDFNLTIPTPNSYTFYVVADDGFCSSEMPVVRPTVIVNELPDVDAGADVEWCAGNPAVTLTANTSVASPTYLWSTGETTQSITVSPAATTTYTVTITNAATSCEASDDVIVNVNALPDVDAGLDQTICFGDPAVALTAATSVGGATFLWSTGETTQTINVSPAATTIYTVTVTNPATGCEASDIVTVNVDPLPDVDAGLDQTICFGDPSVALTAATSVGGATFLWSTGETTQTINVSPAATTVYTVTVTNPATGCDASDNVTVNVNDLPDVSAGADVDMCAGDPAVTLTATSSVPTVSYLWSTGETTQSINVAPAATTTYTVTITNTTTGCSDSDDVIVTVNPLPDVDAGLDQTICFGDPAVALSATTSVGGATYLWSTGETTQNINVSPATTTVYTVTVRNPATGCEASDIVTVNVNPLPDVDAGLDRTICFGDPAMTLTAATSVGGATFLWSTGETTQSINVSPAVTTVYTVTVTNPATGCEATDNVTVNVNSLPDVSAGADVDMCAGDPAVTLTANSTVPTVSYLWSTGETTQSINVAPAATTTYTVTITNTSTGCENSDDVIVTVNPLPDVDAGLDQAICLGDPAIALTANTSVVGATFLWSTGETTQTINVSPAATTTYSVSVTNPATTCSASDDVLVTVNNVTANISISAPVSGGTEICAGTTVTFNAAGVGGSGNYNYDFHRVRGASDVSVQNSTTATYSDGALQNGDIIYVIVTDNTTACFDQSVNITMIVNANPVVALNITNPASGSSTVCDGTNVEFTATPGYDSYDFYLNGGLVQSSASNIYTNNALSTGDQIFVEATQGSCRGSSVPPITMTVNNLPTPTLVSDQAGNIACPAEEVTFTAGGGVLYEFFVDGISQGPAAAATELNYTHPTNNPYNVTVIVTDANGCIATSAPLTITFDPATAGLTADNTTICAGDDVTFNATGGVSYEFFVGVTSVQGPGAADVYVASGLTDGEVVTVEVTNGNGCIDRHAGIPITVTALPIPGLTSSDADNIICAGDEVTFTASGGAWYEFFVNGISVGAGSATNTYTTSSLVDGDRVSVNVAVGPGGCSALSGELIHTVNPLPTPILTSDAPTGNACPGQEVTFTAGGGVNYQFILDDVAQGVPGVATEFKHITAGDFKVEVLVIDGNGCQATSSAINITEDAATAVLAADRTTICAGEDVTFTAAGGVTYEFLIDDVPQVVADPTSNIFVASGLTDGQVVKVKVTNATACEDTHAGIAISVNPLPTADITSSDADNVICVGDEVTFTAAGGDLYEFFINGISVGAASTTNTYVTNALVDGDRVSVNVTNTTTGCSQMSAELVHTVNSLPTAGITANTGPNIISGTDVTFTATGGVEYEFFKNTVLVQVRSVVDTYGPVNDLVDGDVISVNVYNANGCMASADITMSVVDGITPYDLLASDTQYCEDASGVSIYLAAPQAGVSYRLIRTSDDQLINPIILFDGSNTVRWDDVTVPAALTSEEFRVEGFYPTVPGSEVEMNNRVTITRNDLPIVYSILPTGTVTGCGGGAGHEVKLENSETGVSYQLMLDGGNIGAVVNGSTGNEITFGFQTIFGEYTIMATNTATGCSSLMSNTFTIDPDGTYASFDVTGDGSFCAGSSGADVVLEGSESGVEYRVIRDGIEIGDSWTGDGAAHTFGPYTTEGSYSVVVNTTTGCQYPMNGAVTVLEVALPTSYDLEATNNGRFCPGGVVTITISGQQNGVDYELFQDNVSVSSVTGTLDDDTAPLSFGDFGIAGTYRVEARTTGVVCSSSMNNELILVEDALPVVFNVTSDGDYCTGGTTFLHLDGSESDVQYRWEREGDLVTGPWVDGNGGILDFEITGTDTYYIVAMRKDGVTSCTSEMNPRVAITEKLFADLTKVLSIKPGTGLDCNNGAVVIVEASEAGVVYELVKSGIRTGNSVTGDGNDVEFPFAILDIDATYEVYADKDGCEQTLINTIYIDVPGAMKQYAVTGSGDICNGDPGQQFGVAFGDNGVNYTLYLADAPGSNSGTAQQTIVGGGTPITFDLVNNPGEYYVLADDGAGCAIEMLNRETLIVHPLPIAYQISGSGKYCSTEAGAFISLESSEVGVEYIVQMAGIQQGTRVSGSGAELTFGPFTTAGVYTVVAYNSTTLCTSNMNGEVTIGLDADIVNYDIVNTELSYCEADGGVDITLAGQQDGITYQVFNLAMELQAEVVGDASGNQLSLGLLPEGTYTIIASYGGDGCVTQMNSGNAVVITSNSSPLSFNVTTTEFVNVCQGTTIDIELDGSEDTRVYNIVDELNNVVATATGDGNALTIPILCDEIGDNLYEVVAVGTPTCDLVLDVVRVSVKDAPGLPVLEASIDMNYCWDAEGVKVVLTAVESGVDYYIVEKATGNRIGFLSGDAGVREFKESVLAGTYYVIAKSFNSGCDINSSDFVISAYSEIQQFRMKVGTNEGGFEYIEEGEVGTGSINVDMIGLELSTVDVRYTLLKDNVPYSPDYVLDSGTGNPFLFNNSIPEGGIYTILAEENGCSRLMAGSVNIFEKPLEAIDDILPVTYGQNVGDTSVWFNDVSLPAIDINVGPSKNIYFKLLGCEEELDLSELVPWDSEAPQPKHTKDRNGNDMNLVEVYADGSIVFTKLPSFYGRDSIDYVVYNTDYLGSNRYDRGRIYFFAGNVNQAEDELLIPNAFSPNGDGFNDEFVISQFKTEPSESKLEVYNRWGTLVYRSQGKKYTEDFWDGKSNAGMVTLGADLPSGTYYYVFKVDISVEDEDTGSSETVSKEYTGFIELRR
ncbi:gliding motility-associated C-terminal domain-containing protein [Carboxylicivirga sp. RSCT41]|uniref:T9SS type B sorting domain-containing protein n=1 Tax=Carboxylicivirga agarovorans TaxID=3417570 RepID=UPI003D327579